MIKLENYVKRNHKLMKNITYILMILISFSACKSVKNTTSGSGDLNLSAKKVIKNHYKNAFQKNTIKARLKIKYTGKESLPSVIASLRIKRDETIWISLSKFGLPLGKLLITPNRVSYYEKINGTFFDGDFALLSNWAGTTLDFEKVQNLLLGQAILDLKDRKYLVNNHDKKYSLKPKKAYDIFNILFLINADNFKINSQEIQQDDKTVTINYTNYVTIDNEVFPKEIFIKALDHKNKSTVAVNYRLIEFNKKVTFPFKIPKGYKKIVLK